MSDSQLPTAELSPASPSLGSRVWPWVKWGLFGLVIWFVSRQARDMWRDLEGKSLVIDLKAFALCALCTLLAWFPSIWFWRWLLVELGVASPWFPTIHSYLLGHLGKYVPGKATVIVIRTALLRKFGLRPAVGAFTVTLETLTYMAAGVATVAMLAPYASVNVPKLDWLRMLAERPAWGIGVALVVTLAGIVGLSLSSRQFVTLASRMAERRGDGDGVLEHLPWYVVPCGFVLFLAAWWIQGLGLGLAILAVSPTDFAWGDWPRWTGAAAIAMVGGFVALFAPGGLGVREALTLALLSNLEPGVAVLVTVVWRGASLVGELVYTAIFTLVDRSLPFEQSTRGEYPTSDRAKAGAE
ncbi:MAG: YbhN family protein [Planctomycetaceae bacterium]